MKFFVSLAAMLAAGKLGAAEPTAWSEPTSLTSEHLLIDARTGAWVAQGQAVLRTSNLVLRGDQITYSPALRRATARGDVTLVSGLTVAAAEQIELDLSSDEAEITRGVVLQKRNVTPEALIAAKGRDQLEKLGQNTAAMQGKHLKRLGPNEFLVDGLSFTPCDCDPAHPSWHVWSLRANVIPGERATLTLPIIYVGKVPVLAFPWLYLPLSDRRSGLLVPRPASSSRTGFTLDLPVFVTLGRSYDLTFTPGYYSGGSDLIGAKGPRLLTEFNYAPSVGTRGRFTIGLLQDGNPPLVDPVALTVEETGQRGLRGETSWRHLQDLGGGFFDRVDASFVSDGFYPRSLSADILVRVAEYTQSGAQVYRRTADSYAGLDLAVRQDLRFGYGFFDTARTGDDFPAHGPNTPQRLPQLVYDLPEQHLRGPLFGGFRLEYARIAPLLGRRSIDATSLDEQGNPIDYQPLERESRDRIDLRPRVSASFSAGRFARFTPYAAYREDLYLGEVSGTASHRGYPLGGAILETELSRTFGTERSSWRHALIPQLELRYVPRVFGAGPRAFYQDRRGFYDEIDLALLGSGTGQGTSGGSNEGFLQAVAQLGQKLVRMDLTSVRDYLRLDVGQGFDLKAGSRADTFARLTASIWQLNGSAILRYDVPAQRVAQISAGLAYNPRPGATVSVQYDNLVARIGSDNLRRGIDLLVGRVSTIQIDPVGDRAQTLAARAAFKFKFGLSVGYEALAVPTKPPPDLGGDSPLWTIQQQTLSVSLSPSCDCWRLDLLARSRLPIIIPGFRVIHVPNTPIVSDFGASLTIARFGSLGLY